MPFPSIGQLFRPTQQTVAAPQPGPNQPQLPTGAPGSTLQQQNNTLGNPNPAPDNQTQDNSPLAPFAKMWDTPATDKQPTDPWSQPILPNDPAKIQAAAKSMNMLSGIAPELMQKAMAGNDPQAFMDVINAVSQNTLAMSAQLTTASIEKAGTTIRDRSNAGLEDRFKEFQLRNLSVDNPVLNHPGAQGMLKMVRQQIKMQDPSLNAEQIQAKAVEYLNEFAGAMSGQANPKDTTVDAQGNKEQDFSMFLNE